LNPTPSPADFVASLAQPGNDMAKNWLRLAASVPGPGAPADYLARLAGDSARVGALQAEFVEKQRALWGALAGGMRAREHRFHGFIDPPGQVSCAGLAYIRRTL
jgi:hypothetical protein